MLAHCLSVREGILPGGTVLYTVHLNEEHDARCRLGRSSGPALIWADFFDKEFVIHIYILESRPRQLMMLSATPPNGSSNG